MLLSLTEVNHKEKIMGLVDKVDATVNRTEPIFISLGIFLIVNTGYTLL